MKSLHGLTRTLINNMVHGVTEGYEKVLEVNGVGYRAAKQGKKLTLNLGYSHPVEIDVYKRQRQPGTWPEPAARRKGECRRAFRMS